MRTIGFLWWYNPFSKKLFSVLDIQKRALENMGHRVKVFNIMTVLEEENELAELNGCDLVFTSVIPLVLGLRLMHVDTKKYDLIKAPVFFQIDGYGSTTFNENGCNPFFHKITEKADLVTFLDTNVYEEFRKSGQPFDYDKIFFIPNGAEDLLKRWTANEFKKEGEVLIGSLLKENRYKEPWHFFEAMKLVYEAHPEARVVFPILHWNYFVRDHAKLLWLGHSFGKYVRDGKTEGGLGKAHLTDLPNVDFVQHLPYRKIPNFISSCDVFCHYSHGDAFGKTLTEAFSLAVAPVVSDIIRVQGVSASKLDAVVEQIGNPMKEVYEATEKLMYTGENEHYVMAPRGNPEKCAEAVNWMIEHPMERGLMGSVARAWSRKWITWEEKWERIFELCEERGIL